jgi:hypothetical protein
MAAGPKLGLRPDRRRKAARPVRASGHEQRSDRRPKALISRNILAWHHLCVTAGGPRVPVEADEPGLRTFERHVPVPAR